MIISASRPRRAKHLKKMGAAEFITKLNRIEIEIQDTLFKMDKQYRAEFSVWVQDPIHIKVVSSYLSSMIQDYDEVRQIAVIRYCTRQYSIKEIAKLLDLLNNKVDASSLLNGLTMLWHRDRKKELLFYLNSQ